VNLQLVLSVIQAVHLSHRPIFLHFIEQVVDGDLLNALLKLADDVRIHPQVGIFESRYADRHFVKLFAVDIFPEKTIAMREFVQDVFLLIYEVTVSK